MDNHEIKMRLAACRPGGQDADDPAIREAMGYLQDDAELRAWFEREQAIDAAIADRLSQVQAPAALRTQILAGARVSRAIPWWQRKIWLAAAAILAALMVVKPWQRAVDEPGGGPAGLQTGTVAVASLREYRDDVAGAFAGMKETGFNLDLWNSDVQEVREWLKEQGAPGDVPLKPGLEQAHPFGCKIIDWRGQRVSIMCFGKNNDEAHLFVVDRRAIGELGDLEAGRIEKVLGREIMAWQDERWAYVIVGDTPKTELKDFL